MAAFRLAIHRGSVRPALAGPDSGVLGDWYYVCDLRADNRTASFVRLDAPPVPAAPPAPRPAGTVMITKTLILQGVANPSESRKTGGGTVPGGRGHPYGAGPVPSAEIMPGWPTQLPTWCAGSRSSLLCRRDGAVQPPAELETLEVGWFGLGELPPLSLGRVNHRQLERALAHHRDPSLPTEFD